MITEYSISSGPWCGTCLRLGRVPRSVIDRFTAEHPEPEAPLKRADELGVEIWALPDEMLPDNKDAGFVAARIRWQGEFSRGMFSLLSEAIHPAQEDSVRARREFKELRREGLTAQGYTEHANILISTILGDKADLDAVCELIQYNSTVTLRGLVEAAKAYNVRYMGKKVPVAVLGGSHKATANSEYNDRLTAQWAGYKWGDFCTMSGPEQSAEVALYRISQRLERLMSK